VYVIAKQKAEVEGVDKQIDDTKTNVSQLQTQGKQLSDQFDALKTQHDTMQQQFNQKVSDFNAECAGKPVSSGCQSEKDSLSSEDAQLEPVLQQMEQQAVQLNNQMQNLSNDLVLAQFKVQKLTNYKSQVEAAVAKLESQLVSRCAGVTASSSLEEMKHKCGNIQFDGARADLPACTTDACLQYDAMQAASKKPPRR
jgi:phage shock protein A